MCCNAWRTKWCHSACADAYSPLSELPHTRKASPAPLPISELYPESDRAHQPIQTRSPSLSSTSSQEVTTA
eukprot:354212-Chlamydomonas_euryale.AAC.6